LLRDYLFQCAAATSPNATAEELERVHVTGTRNVLRAAAEYLPTRYLVFLAARPSTVPSRTSASRSKRTNTLIRHHRSARPRRHRRSLALTAAADWNLRVLVARPFNLLGPGLPEHYLAAALAKRLLQEEAMGQPLSVANADATRDFVDVRDAVEALVVMVERAAPSKGSSCVFNIASQRETTVSTLPASCANCTASARPSRSVPQCHGRASVGVAVMRRGYDGQQVGGRAFLGGRVCERCGADVCRQALLPTPLSRGKWEEVGRARRIDAVISDRGPGQTRETNAP